MKQLIFATHNNNKCEEIKAIIGEQFKILNLSDIDIHEDIPETGSSFKENALQKALHIYNTLGCDCFADDSGLCVDALDGRPGIYSARFAGEPSNSKNNIAKLLMEMKTAVSRNAHFSTVIALIMNGQQYFFEGKINGTIINAPQGSMGFGYDPVFVPDGFDKTFAELSADIKNKISHRAIATKKFCDFLINR